MKTKSVQYTPIMFVVTMLVTMITAIPCERVISPDNKCPLADTNSNVKIPPTFYTHPDDCTKFYECVQGEPEERSCCKGTVFNDELDMCVIAGSEKDVCTPANPQRECERGTVDLIPHPTACQTYYNCSEKSQSNTFSLTSKFDDYEHECRYPGVFDIHTKKCESYLTATCGKSRVAAKWKCDYKRYQCTRCMPCSMSHPSCLGKEDGQWAHPLEMWAPTYMECKSERFVKFEQCLSNVPTRVKQVFSPLLRKCVPLWEVPREHDGYEPSCDDKKTGYYSIPEVENITYKCPEKEYFLCTTPLSVHHDINKCSAI